MKTLCIAGLGNPGKEYFLTRHNAGFIACDFLADYFGTGWKEKKGRAAYSEHEEKDTRIILSKPLTYMNLSGNALLYLSERFSLKKNDFIIIYDDFSLPFGKMRLRKNGSSGGHKGMESVIQVLGGPEIMRIRIGIGNLPAGILPEDYVLSRFSKEERKLLPQVFTCVKDIVFDIIAAGIDESMNRHNGK